MHVFMDTHKLSYKTRKSIMRNKEEILRGGKKDRIVGLRAKANIIWDRERIETSEEKGV